MKNFKNLNNRILVYLGIAALIGIFGGYLVASENYLNTNNEDAEESETYGYGYGNGYGMQKGNGNGQGNGSQMMGKGNGNGFNQKNCLADECLYVDELEYPVGELTDEAKDALEKALDDEYKAYSIYDAVISSLGVSRPFTMIIRAEESHISSLKALFDKYGLSISENPYVGKITSPTTLQEACQAGVDAEIANTDLYREELLPAVADYEDITGVFTNLMNASANKHLPAFERCN